MIFTKWLIVWSQETEWLPMRTRKTYLQLHDMSPAQHRHTHTHSGAFSHTHAISIGARRQRRTRTLKTSAPKVAARHSSQTACASPTRSRRQLLPVGCRWGRGIRTQWQLLGGYCCRDCVADVWTSLLHASKCKQSFGSGWFVWREKDFECSKHHIMMW
jgi:hypothetical protein